MTPLQDAIALVVTVSIGVLLFASMPARTLPGAAEATSLRPSASMREVCAADMARFCAHDVVPRRVWSCMQANVEKLRPACRLTLEGAGMIAK